MAQFEVTWIFETHVPTLLQMEPPDTTWNETGVGQITKRYVPLGVVAAISPWNLRFWLSFTKVLPALLAGNTVVLKPAVFTPWRREPEAEAELMPTLEGLGIGLVPCSPLGKGFLTGKVDENTKFGSSDFRSTLPRFTPAARKANRAVVDLLSEFAQQKKATPAQLALAWLLAKKP